MDDPPVVHISGLRLITCGICFCAIVERFWDKHLQVHVSKGEVGE